jgi:hypothetical protein
MLPAVLDPRTYFPTREELLRFATCDTPGCHHQFTVMNGIAYPIMGLNELTGEWRTVVGLFHSKDCFTRSIHQSSETSDTIH